MIVLGVGAWLHDSAAALIVDGELVGHIEEDRLSGEKHTSAFPQRGLDWLLASAGIDACDIDVVGYPFAPRLFARNALNASIDALARPSRRAGQRATSAWTVWRRMITRLCWLEARFPAARVVGVPHHVAHATYAAAYSPRRPCCVLTVDSIGEHTTASIATVHDEPQAVRPLARDPHSLGYAYGAATQHLGWRRGDGEGTLMALAASGDRLTFAPLMNEGIRLTPDGIALGPEVFAPRLMRAGAQRLGPRLLAAVTPRAAAGLPSAAHADLAAALQHRTEEAMVHLARLARGHSDADVLCLAGGVATNCLAAAAVAASGLFDEVAVPPAPGDSGAAAGAALTIAAQATAEPILTLRGADVGPLAQTSVQRNAATSPSLARQIALRLDAGEIVGVCVGRAEAGPRALGRRSILASPRRADIRHRLARHVKQRELFRPFAPAVLSDQCADYFVTPAPSPYMSFAVPVTDHCRREAPAVVHADGTARVQTVEQDGSLIAQVLQAFHAQTGCPVLINTSLNVRGRPTACTAVDALQALRECHLDALVLDDRVIEPS